MTNIALALRRFPEILPMVSEIVAMASDFRGVGSENARIEHNIACDSVAADIVLRSGLPVTLIGLNVTEQTAMTQEEVDALKAIGGPLAQFLTGMHEIWFQRIRRNHSAMHDGLTMALMLDPSLMTLETYVVEVITHGAKTGSTVYSAPQEGRLVCQVATTVDAPRYHALLQGRVQSAVRASLSA
jgi:purine nucleosidase